MILYSCRNTYRSSIITILRYLHRFSICVLCSFPHPSATLSSPFPSNVILRTKNVQTVSVNSIFSQGSDPMLEFQSLGFTNKPAKHRSFWFLAPEVSSPWFKVISRHMTCHVTMVHPELQQAQIFGRIQILRRYCTSLYAFNSKQPYFPLGSFVAMKFTLRRRWFQEPYFPSFVAQLVENNRRDPFVGFD